MKRLLLVLLSMFSQAAAVSMLWAWFVVPLGAPEVSRAHALGLALLYDAFHPLPDNLDPDDKNMRLLAHAFTMWFLIGVGWVVSVLTGIGL